MFGALEAKTVTALVAQHRATWKPAHTAILDCLLAYRNPKSGLCCPDQQTIASHLNVCRRTVLRHLAELELWGVLRTKRKPRVANQYAILFALPAVPGEQLDLFAPAPAATVATSETKVPARETKMPIPETIAANTARRRPVYDASTYHECKATLEMFRRHDLAAPERRRQLLQLGYPAELVEYLDRDPALERAAGACNYRQADFDARDWRKLQREVALMREATIGGRERVDPDTFFRMACERAGISEARGEQLYGRMVA